MASTISSQYGTFTITDTGTSYTADGPDFSAVLEYTIISGNEVTGDGFGYGWGPYYGLKAAAYTAIVEACNTKIRDMTHAQSRDILSNMRDDLRVLKLRGENPMLGIYMNHVCHTCEDERALLMHALNEIQTTSAVIAEKNSPTPPASFFPYAR